METSEEFTADGGHTAGAEAAPSRRKKEYATSAVRQGTESPAARKTNDEAGQYL